MMVVVECMCDVVSGWVLLYMQAMHTAKAAVSLADLMEQALHTGTGERRVSME
jgi:hypothetical protein